MVESETFLGKDLREALASVKRSFGDEALILATREVKQGIFGHPMVEVVVQKPAGAPSKKANVLASFDAALPDIDEDTESFATAVPARPPQTQPSDMDSRLRPLEAEIRRLRAQLVSLVRADGRVKTRGFAAVNPDSGSTDAGLKSHLLALGLQASLAERWTKVLRAERRDIMMRLEKLVFDTVAVGAGIGEDGARLVMCVGPSGAGKTTTLAKWAAKAHLEEDKSVAIVTLDAFRAGAVAQARRYAELIGCPLALAEDMATLQLALDKHADKDLVFVDTAGRDPSAQAELQTVAAAIKARDKRGEVHLTLPAMFGPRSMRATLDIYKHFGANRLCFTKIDEVIDFAPVALIGASAGLPLSYWTTGQRIPDDIERISAQGFAERTLHALSSSLFGSDIQVEERFI